MLGLASPTANLEGKPEEAAQAQGGGWGWQMREDNAAQALERGCDTGRSGARPLMSFHVCRTHVGRVSGSPEA